MIFRVQRPAKPAKPAAEPSLMDDLLGMDFGTTNQNNPADVDPFSSDLTGVMDMLNNMGSATEPASTPADTSMDFTSILSPSEPVPDAPAAEPIAEPEPISFSQPVGKFRMNESSIDKSSLIAFEEDGIKVEFKLKKGEDDSDTIIKAIISNSNPDDVEEFNIQAAVPKYMKVQTKPISDPIIPCNNEDISTQLFRIKNNAFGEVREMCLC